ncbi:tRNA pseudouridine(55) synthase TruB [Buchnera aphidicola]|uniref:tRNA pseudouridine(55) synthase TruB n=1 Tax=Buchnera aphidicola TaxID=9 RepID=UPI001E42929A|nr:tRNA pseudouridine(55) synthase TruB [Buchnera aphidicola]
MFPSINITYLQFVLFKKGQKVLLSHSIYYKNKIVRITYGLLKQFVGIGFIDNKNYLVPRRLITIY